MEPVLRGIEEDIKGAGLGLSAYTRQVRGMVVENAEGVLSPQGGFDILTAEGYSFSSLAQEFPTLLNDVVSVV